MEYSYGDWKILDLSKEGNGVLPKPFSQAAELAMEGHDFDACYDRGAPFSLEFLTFGP